jgi:site-specific DNA recombinase
MAIKKDDQVQKRVAFYLRVSTDDQADKYGLPLQKSALEKLIASKGVLDNGQDRYILAGEEYIYEDEISGTLNIEDRPGFGKMIEDVELSPDGKPPFDIVAIFKIDRLARKLKILLNVVEFFENHKIEFISANETIDTSTPFGRAVLGILGVIAELEVENISIRTQAGRAEARRKGVVFGSATYYGYDKNLEKQLEINEEESKIIEDIFRWFVVERKSYSQIADILKSRGMLTPDASAIKHGKRKGQTKKKYSPTFWRGEGVKKILENEVYIGNMHYGKTKKGKKVPKDLWEKSPHKHDEIVDDATFALAQKYIQVVSKDTLSTKEKRGEHIYLLSGLLKCQYCKSVVTPDHVYSNWVGDRKEYKGKYLYSYKCGRKNKKKHPTSVCSTVPIPAEPLEKLIVNFVRDLFRNPQYIFNFQKELASNRKHIKHLQKRKKRFQKVVETYPGRKANIRKQHEMEGDDDIFMQQMKEIGDAEIKVNQDLSTLTAEINQLTLPTNHIQSFLEFAEKYKDKLEDVLEDRKATYELIHLFLEEIVIESRNLRETDVLGGRKKKGQMLPFALHLKVRLPQKAVVELAKKKFGVNSSNL